MFTETEKLRAPGSPCCRWHPDVSRRVYRGYAASSPSFAQEGTHSCRCVPRRSFIVLLEKPLIARRRPNIESWCRFRVTHQLNRRARFRIARNADVALMRGQLAARVGES